MLSGNLTIGGISTEKLSSAQAWELINYHSFIRKVHSHVWCCHGSSALYLSCLIYCLFQFTICL